MIIMHHSLFSYVFSFKPLLVMRYDMELDRLGHLLGHLQGASKLANAKFTKNKLFLAPLITLFMVKFGAYVENVLKPCIVTKTTHTLILF
jgi:hypothetical protein